MNDKLKQRVVQAYSERIAGNTGCCGSSTFPAGDLKVIQTDRSGDESCCTTKNYEELKGLGEGAAAQSFGCGNPVGLSSVVPGEVVVDLGSGAGLDCITAAKRAGETGKVVGIDLSDEMINTARKNVDKLSLGDRITFLKGDIDSIPLGNDYATLVISNCVIALAPDKQKVFDEAYRILRSNGRFVVSDIVSDRQIPEELVENMELYVSCVTGAAQVDEYLSMLRRAGFRKIEEVERHGYGALKHRSGNIRTFSITLRAYK